MDLWMAITLIVAYLSPIVVKIIESRQKRHDDLMKVGMESYRLSVESAKEVFKNNRMERGTSTLPPEYWIIVASQARSLFEKIKSEEEFENNVAVFKKRISKIRSVYGKRYTLLEEHNNNQQGENQ